MIILVIFRFVDKFNSNKIWILKKYKSGHLYLNQEICGKLFYSKFIRINSFKLRELGFII